MRFRKRIVKRLGNGRGDRRDERLVDGRIQRGGAGIGDLRRNRAQLLIHVVFELGLLERVGEDGGHVAAEILGHNEHRIRLAAFQQIHCGVAIGYIPIELIVLLELLDDLVAQLKIAERLVVGTRILVHHAYAKLTGIAIRIPESNDVEPGVQRRKHHQEQDDEPTGRRLGDTLQIAEQHAKDVAHERFPPL